MAWWPRLRTIIFSLLLMRGVLSAGQSILLTNPVCEGVEPATAESFILELAAALARHGEGPSVTWAAAKPRIRKAGLEWFEGCPNPDAAATAANKLGCRRALVGKLWVSNDRLNGDFQMVNARLGIVTARVSYRGEQPEMDRPVTTAANAVAAQLAAARTVEDADSLLSRSARRQSVKVFMLGASLAVAGTVTLALFQNFTSGRNTSGEEDDAGSGNVVIEW